MTPMPYHAVTGVCEVVSAKRRTTKCLVGMERVTSDSMNVFII